MMGGIDQVLGPRVVKVRVGPFNLAYIADPDLRERTKAALASMPTRPDGKPVKPIRRALLGEGGVPVPGGAAFFRNISGHRDGTENVYGSDLRMWVEACQSVGADPLFMDYDTLVEYRDDVRLDEDGVTAGTWNSGLPALRAFHDAALGDGLIPSPLMNDADWKRLRLTRRDVHWPRLVSKNDYMLFRSVGLNCLSFDGRMTKKAHALRTPVRDALFADFLVTHGVRRAEATHMTLLDLPRRVSGRRRNTGWIPGAIAKWGSGRRLEESIAWAQRLHTYHDTEWFITVETAQRALRRQHRNGMLMVVTKVARRFERNTELTLQGAGGTRNLLTLTKEERRRLVCTAEVADELAREEGMSETLSMVARDWLVPLAIFPGTRAPMLSPEAWSMTFREANNRVDFALRTIGAPACERVTPHRLRHTFAVNTLSDLISEVKDADRAYLANLDEARRTDTAMIRRRFMNPLIEVQNLLGHRSMDTTLIYLNVLMNESQATIPFGDSWIEAFIGVTP